MLVLSTLTPAVDAATRSNKENENKSKSKNKNASYRKAERPVRGSLSAKTKSKGPWGSSRRRLQDYMGAPLADGYGGQGGVSKDQESLPMRDQFTPVSPTLTPVAPTSPAPTADAQIITYLPGMLTVMEGDLILSQGLTSRIIGLTDTPVVYGDGTSSIENFHEWPDGAATFVDNRAGNEGGWIYLSNVEDKKGGVGALTFDKLGNIINYEMILTSTSWNCNGGRTPWGTWITAEEDFDKAEGRAWQVDPYNVREAVVINMGNAGGVYEAFAYDVRNREVPRFYLTEDNVFGALERFTPLSSNWDDPWNILLGPGVNEWLILVPNVFNPTTGTYSWTTDLDTARSSAGSYYPETEGIDVAGSNLFFVCKGIRTLFTLDLDGNTYTSSSTSATELFEGEPDMIRTVLGEESAAETLLYFTEDNGRRAGIHARNEAGELMTILEGFYSPETTGLAFSPNGMFMYVCFQEDGYCFAITRTDGLSFRAKTLNLKRHATEVGSTKITRL